MLRSLVDQSPEYVVNRVGPAARIQSILRLGGGAQVMLGTVSAEHQLARGERAVRRVAVVEVAGEEDRTAGLAQLDHQARSTAIALTRYFAWCPYFWMVAGLWTLMNHAVRPVDLWRSRMYGILRMWPLK